MLSLTTYPMWQKSCSHEPNVCCGLPCHFFTKSRPLVSVGPLTKVKIQVVSSTSDGNIKELLDHSIRLHSEKFKTFVDFTHESETSASAASPSFKSILPTSAEPSFRKETSEDLIPVSAPWVAERFLSANGFQEKQINEHEDQLVVSRAPLPTSKVLYQEVGIESPQPISTPLSTNSPPFDFLPALSIANIVLSHAADGQPGCPDTADPLLEVDTSYQREEPAQAIPKSKPKKEKEKTQFSQNPLSVNTTNSLALKNAASKISQQKLPIKDRKRTIISPSRPPSLTKAMVHWVSKTQGLLDPFREDEDCWFHPSPPAARFGHNGIQRPFGSLQKSFTWQDQSGKHSVFLNYGIVSKLINFKMTKQQKDGFVNNRWHLSHLCGNWTCLNPSHTTIEPGTVNVSRNNCFSHRSGCLHTPQCMKEKKISLGADGKPTDHISSSNSSVSMAEDDVDNWTQNFDGNGDYETKQYGDDPGLHDKFRRLKMTKASLDDVEMDPTRRDQLGHDMEIPRADLEFPDTYRGEAMKGDLKKNCQWW